MYTVKVYNKMNNVVKEFNYDSKDLAIRLARFKSYYANWTAVEDEDFNKIAIFEKGNQPF